MTAADVRRAHQARHTRLAEALGMDPGFSADTVIDEAIARDAVANRRLEGVSHALESLVDPDMAHDDPARAARIVAEMVSERAALNDAALRAAYASGFMAGHACGVHEPDLSSDDVFGAAANCANQYALVGEAPV